MNSRLYFKKQECVTSVTETLAALPEDFKSAASLMRRTFNFVNNAQS